MKVVSFIPIKLNNQRLPGKNLLPLAGKPMCEYIFDTVNKVDNIDEKYVFCSDEAICEYIPDGLTFLKRDAWLDGYEVKGLQIIENFVNRIPADIYVLTHVTAPFLKPESIENAVNKIAHEGYDSAFSATEFKGYFWYKGKPLNYDMKDIVTTQNVEPLYFETGGFFIFTKEVFTEKHQRIGENPFMYVIDQIEGVDIDEKEDYDFAQIVAEYQKRD